MKMNVGLVLSLNNQQKTTTHPRTHTLLNYNWTLYGIQHHFEHYIKHVL